MYIRYILLPVLAVLIAAAAGCGGSDRPESFILDADLRGLTSDTVVVHDAMSYRDTSFIVVQRDGKFRFESRPDTFTLYKFTFNDGADYFYCFAQKGSMVEAVGCNDSANIILSCDIDANRRLMTFESALRDSIARLAAGHHGDAPRCAAASDSVANAMAASYILSHADDYVSAVVFLKYMWESRHPDFALMDSVTGAMSGLLLDLPEVQRAKSVIDRKMTASPGRNVYLPSLDFTDGTTLGVTDGRRGYLFIEFWASWSHPSLAYRERLKDIYATFRGKTTREDGRTVPLTFIGVSLDTDRHKCDSVTGAMGIGWRQVCEGTGWASDLPGKYAVTYLPDNVLVGRNNKVIARGLTIEQLDSLLTSTFGR